MKNRLLILLVIILLSSCQEAVKMGYDETKNNPILETEINKSPKENVVKFLADAGVTANTINIYSSVKKSCECAKNGKDCYCKLSNSGLSSHACSDAEKICEKTKYIEVEIAPQDVDKLSSLGFSQSDQ